jgi:lipopolysaccharide/colanic/teichoic acid biosynthesis glycosyltransferase
MIAIIIATGRNDAFEGIQEHIPVPLLPLADRPILQHIIEYLADQGIRRFEFLLSHLPEKVEASCGDGARWGCSCHYHLLPSGGDPLRLAHTIATGTDDLVVLGNAERLPDFKLSALAPPTLIYHGGAWTGWGLFSAQDIQSPLAFDRLTRVESQACLSIATGFDFLSSQRQVLERSFPGLLVSSREVDPGIWISRNVALHPTARLTPPLYIGENCRIGRSARIGPSAVIGHNCIVSDHTIVRDSMVMPGTYVGEGLELDSVIVDRNRLLNIKLQTSLLASEAFLLGSLTKRDRSRTVYRLASAAVALVLLVFLWPLVLAVWLILTLTRRGSLVAQSMVRIPANDDPSHWMSGTRYRFQCHNPAAKPREFLHEFLPGLISVLKGDLFLVGVAPRKKAQILALPSDWRALYLKTKAGLITESAVMFAAPTDDDLYTAEAYYSATESLRHDCRLLGLWFVRMLAGSGRPGADLVEDTSS